MRVLARVCTRACICPLHGLALRLCAFASFCAQVLVDELLDNGHTMHTMLEHLMGTLQVPREDVVTCCLLSIT